MKATEGSLVGIKYKQWVNAWALKWFKLKCKVPAVKEDEEKTSTAMELQLKAWREESSRRR